MPRLPLHLARCFALSALLAAGCAINRQSETPDEPRVPVEAAEPSPSDPFAAIDAAFQRLAIDRDEPAEARPLVWPRLVERFEFGACPADGSSARWAAWYADNHEYMRRVFNRARPWLHFIVNEIEHRGVPGELALLPVVESAFDPFAYSHGRAAGPWQFLSGTARDFGVEINDFYDGRRDFVAATGAALDYLEYLAGMFDGDWSLALAAYNAGQGRVSRAVRRNAARGRGTEWHELPLPRETRGYIPKLQGLACLIREPARYGFVLPTIVDRPQVRTVALDGPVDIVALALHSELDLTELVTLNAGLNKHLTPPSGPHYLVVPHDAAERVEASLPDLPEPPPVPMSQIRVRRGDSLSVLARRHDTTVDALRKANGISGSRLIAGQTLKLPGRAGDIPPTSGDAAYREALQQLASLQQQLLPTDRFIHRVRGGESLWIIARRYGVSVDELQRMNGLGASTLIRPGQRLVIETDRKVASPQTAPERYVVRQGDSLWLISRRHRVGLDDLMRWNDLNPDSVLRPGQELIIRSDA